ncbi:MAG: hypothetical protein GY719_05750 [bacterium]|nr:hypothetical protein [bacterium]
MPVRKYRSVEEMEGNTWRQSGDPQLFRAMRSTWELAHRLLRPTFPPGVHKHRSIEDADRQRQLWEKANFETYRSRVSSLP